MGPNGLCELSLRLIRALLSVILRIPPSQIAPHGAAPCIFGFVEPKMVPGCLL